MNRLLTALCLALSTSIAWGDDFEFDGAPNQQDFERIAEDLAATLGYKAVHPAETGGIAGIEIGLFASYLSTEHPDAWQNMTGARVEELGVVGARAIKGLPLGFEVGAGFATVPGTDAELLSAEVRYAIVEGGVALPAVSVRAAVSSLQGADQLDFDSRSLDVSISKGLTLATPYAGIGSIWTDAEAQTSLGSFDADPQETRVFAGVRFGLGLLDITPEYERVGDNDVFNLLIGLSI